MANPIEAMMLGHMHRKCGFRMVSQSDPERMWMLVSEGCVNSSCGESEHQIGPYLSDLGYSIRRRLAAKVSFIPSQLWDG